MKLDKETRIELKERIFSLSNSLKDNNTEFKQGIVIGQIIAYSSVLGVLVPVGTNGVTEILEWAKDTFK